MVIDKNARVILEFGLTWKSLYALHHEKYLARPVTIGTDLFPEQFLDSLLGKKTGDEVTYSLGPGEAESSYREDYVLHMARDDFRECNSCRAITPQFGRFYPWGFLRNLSGVFPQDVRPFRVIGIEGNSFIADLNHPLATYPIELSIKVVKVSEKSPGRGGRVVSWIEEATGNGPGMQARWQGRQTDFSSPMKYSRKDETVDSTFYMLPRLTGHVDSRASKFIQEVYAEGLNTGHHVLDLMSSVQSHLPCDMDLSVTGLGLNREELASNPRLKSFVIHDLNQNPVLPFPDRSFHTVLCSLSVEYLIDPLSVFNEVARVLMPGGRFFVSFSNRWFPPKTTCLWTELHEFERAGLVLDYFLSSGAFIDLQTFSARNWKRPEDDPHYPEVLTSDPVYVVWGRRRA